MLAAKSLDGKRTLRQWLDIQTDRPKLLIFNEGDLGGDRTSQSLITPLLDQSNLIVILSSNQSGRLLLFLPDGEIFNRLIGRRLPVI